MSWPGYLRTLLLTTLVSVLVAYTWILLVDPYDNVWFSPPLEREPISKNQRFSYPALARSPRFDSLILGTSSIRLLSPHELDPLLDASFANLAMDAATPYEQSQILALFVRHHPQIRYALHSIDDFWCNPSSEISLFTHRPFPQWMYDENRWNDLLYLFNSATLEQAWRQFRNQLGSRTPVNGRDGYTVFVPPESKYDLQKVQHKIYGSEQPHLKPAVAPPWKASGDERSAWTYPNLELLREMLGSLPADTTKVLIFPPYHQRHLPAPGSIAAAQHIECKARVARLAAKTPNTTLIDFMFRSPITLEDKNFWDPEHHRVGIATLIVESVVSVLASGTEHEGFYRVLAHPGNRSERARTSPLGQHALAQDETHDLIQPPPFP